MQYKIICELKAEFLEKRIESFLKEGWKLAGGPFLDAYNYYCQAITKSK